MSKKNNGWPPSGFGGRLRALREAAGLRQEELAEKAGCNVFTISKTERELQEPGWPLVLALARALDVPITDFLTTQPAPPRKPGRPLKDPIAGPQRPRPSTAKTKRKKKGRREGDESS